MNVINRLINTGETESRELTPIEKELLDLVTTDLKRDYLGFENSFKEESAITPEYQPKNGAYVYGLHKDPRELAKKYQKQLTSSAEIFAKITANSTESSADPESNFENLLDQIVKDSWSFENDCPQILLSEKVNDSQATTAAFVRGKNDVIQLKFPHILKKSLFVLYRIRNSKSHTAIRLSNKKSAAANILHLIHEITHYDEPNNITGHEYRDHGVILSPVTEALTTSTTINYALKLIKIFPKLLDDKEFVRAVTQNTAIYNWVMFGEILPNGKAFNF